MENFIYELQTMLVNFWFGGWDNYNTFVWENVTNNAPNKWTFFTQWIADLPNIGVCFMALFVLGFAWLICYFFWCLINVVKYQDRGEEYENRWKRKK